jgi:hypothetical protein
MDQEKVGPKSNLSWRTQSFKVNTSGLLPLSCSTPEPRIHPETGEAEEAEPLNEYEAEDWVAASALFAAAGVGLGRCEAYAVGLALHKLGQDPAKNVATARFFGKLFGTAANYYVFETTLKGEEEEVSTHALLSLLSPYSGCGPDRSGIGTVSSSSDVGEGHSA